MTDTHRFLFTLSMLELGKFKPITLAPQGVILVAIDVPLKPEYIANIENILTNPLVGNPPPDPILSLAGLRYALDQGQAALDDYYLTHEDLVGSDDEDDADDIEIIE